MRKRHYAEILGQHIPINYKGKDPEEAGHYDEETKSIVISEEEKGQSFAHTVIHEMVHAMSDRAGIKQAISKELEEVIAENVATMIVENFKIDWL